MNINNSFFTQSGNFSSAISGGVDPRTGLYNISLSLGTVKGNGGLGPDFPVNLSYTPLSPASDSGFGNGVSLGLSVYDPASGKLSLSTGEQYQIDRQGQGNNLSIRQNKIDSFHFERQDNNSYKITRSSGDTEFLMGDKVGGNMKYPTRLVNAAGYTLYIEMDKNNRISSIHEEPKAGQQKGDTLLSIDYDSHLSRTTLIFYPEKTESYSVFLDTDNGYLKTVTKNISVTEKLLWTLGYEDVPSGDKWVTSLASPGGMKETVSYRLKNAHQFPDSAPRILRDTGMPYVEKHEKNPGAGQPVQVSTFTFSPENYLGAKSDVSWNDKDDNLYACPTSYEYSSEETRHNDNGENQIITRTYNSFHLQKIELTQCGNFYSEKIIEYRYIKENGSFDAQPANFQFPTATTTTWTDKSERGNILSRKEKVTTEFSDKGLQTKQSDADGTETTWEYYPAEGEGDKCPPEPNGFTRFMKNETVISRDHKSKQTAYTYATAEHVGTDISNLVMKASETHSADDVILQTINFTYGTSAQNTAGVLTGKATTYHNGTTDYTTTEEVTFRDTSVNVNGKKIDARTSDFILTSHDKKPLVVTRSKTVSRMTGRTLEKTSSQGIITAYTRNLLGWLLTREHCKGSEYENITTYDYTVDDSSGLSVTTTDAQGNKTHHALDGMGRLHQVKINDPDMDSKNPEPGFVMHEQSWDALGRSVHSSAYDYLQAGSKTNPEQTQTQTQTYDNWGQVSQSVGPDNVVTHTKTVLVPTLTADSCVWQTHSWQSGGLKTTGITVTTLDTNHHPVKTELYPKDAVIGTSQPYSQTSSEYDGWNRLVSQTDELGQTTTYTYDAWSRPTITTLPDGTQTVREYVPFSSAKLPVSIRVVSGDKPKQMGTQTFDGLGRLRSTTCGGRTETFEYDAAHQRHPARIIAADGAIAHYTYIPELNDAPQSLTTTGTTPERAVNQEWTYNPQTGALLSSREGLQTTTYAYTPSGTPDKVTVADGSIERSNSLSARTVGGTPLIATDYAGVEQTLTQDGLGRPKFLADPDVLSTLVYDDLGQLTQWTATSVHSGSRKTTSLTLDDYGRETKRTIETRDKGGLLTDTLTVTQAWSKTHQVTHRTTTRTVQGNTVILRDETYAFHPQRGWLTTYTVTGTTPPQDETGRALKEQIFLYDITTGNMKYKLAEYAGKSGGSAPTIYLFDNQDDPCQLTRIQAGETHEITDLTYDAAGRLTQDEYGRTLTYDALGRLMKVSDKAGNVLSQYRYDSGNQLAAQTSGGACNRRYYMNDQLVCLTDGQNNSTRLTPYAQVSTGTNVGTWLASTDMTGSVLAVADGEKAENYAYTPYGVQSKNA